MVYSGRLFFCILYSKIEKKGTQSIKRGPKPLKRSSWGRRDPLGNSEVAKALKKNLIDHHLPPDEQSLWPDEDLVVTREGRQVVDVYPPKSSKFQATE